MNAQNEKRLRLAAMVILGAVFILLMGANRIGDSILSRKQTMENARHEWFSAAGKIFPDRSDKDLTKVFSGHPETILRMFCIQLEPEKE